MFFAGPMKTLILSLFTLLIAPARMEASSVWEWTFDSDTTVSAIGDGTLGWSTPEAQAQTTFAITDGAVVPHIGGLPAGYLHIPAYTNPDDFAQLSFNDSEANGGGVYLNQYTIIMDVYFTAPWAWLPFFNTHPTNLNDADLYISPNGALGIGDLGYSPNASVSIGTWHRIIFAANLGAGVVTYYLDGNQIFQRLGGSLLDGRFSLYSSSDPGPDLILGNEGDNSGIYTRDWLLASFAFTDHTLTGVEASQLGSPKARGIYVTTAPPPQLRISLNTAAVPNIITLDWDLQGYILQRSTDLTTWVPVPGTIPLKTYSEPVIGPRASFKLANP
jgi:hypothetical protein